MENSRGPGARGRGANAPGHAVGARGQVTRVGIPRAQRAAVADNVQ